MADPKDQASETPPESTLEDVYKEFNVEQQAQQFQAATAPKPPTQGYQPPQEPVVPDPVTEAEAFRRWQMDQYHQTHQAHQNLSALQEQLQHFSQAEMVRQVQTDIGRAVELVNKRLNADPEMVAVALDLESRRDPRFFKLWEGRYQNPQAWDKALDAWSRKMDGKFSVRADPQLAENQRAVRMSQQAMAQAPRRGPADDWDNLGNEDFSHKWNQLLND